MSISKIFPAVLLVAIAMPGLSLAAGLPRPAVVNAATLAPAFDWNGFYIGVNGGFGWGHNRSAVGCDDTDPTCIINGLSDGLDASGGLGGVTAGYNYVAASPFLLGIEGDLDFASISGSVFESDGFNNNTLTTKYSSLATLRGRVGVVNGPALMYATGGLAAGSVADSLNYSNTAGDTGSAGASGIVAGWTVGGGIEYALAANATAKLEYQHIDLGSRTFETGDYWGNATSRSTVSHTLEVVKVGLNWKF